MLDGVLHDNVSACIEGDFVFSFDDTTLHNVLASFERYVVAKDSAFIDKFFRFRNNGISFQCALVSKCFFRICNQGIGTDEAAVFCECLGCTCLEIDVRVEDVVGLAIHSDGGGF